MIGNKAYKYEGIEIDPYKSKKELNILGDESSLFMRDLIVELYNCVLEYFNLWGAYFDTAPFVIGKNSYFIQKWKIEKAYNFIASKFVQ